MDRMWIPVQNSWRLNERHYGALQGLNKAETAAKFGDEQVLIWRRSYDVPPPALDEDDERHPKHDPALRRAAARRPAPAPSRSRRRSRGFSPTGTGHRPGHSRGQRVLIAAHGNSLRALVKHLDRISDEEIVGLNIPTGIPLVYELRTTCARWRVTTWGIRTRPGRPPRLSRLRDGRAERAGTGNAITTEASSSQYLYCPSLTGARPWGAHLSAFSC